MSKRFPALLDAGGPLEERFVTKLELEQYQTIRAAEVAAATRWRVYTPTWTAVTADPVIGNGTREGFYIQVGRMVTVRFRIQAGSTTTFGTGAWRVGLPVTALADPVGFAEFRGFGSGVAVENGVGDHTLTCYTFTTTSFRVQVDNAANTEVSTSSPFTWGDVDSLNGMITYEAA